MKKNKILFTSLFTTLGTVALGATCSIAFMNISSSNDINSEQQDEPFAATTKVLVNFKARSTQTGETAVTFVGPTTVKAVAGKPFASVAQPVAYMNKYVFDHWEYEDGSTVKDSDLVPKTGVTVYPYFQQDIELKNCVGLQALHDSTVSLIVHGLDKRAAPDVKWSMDGVTWKLYTLGQILPIKSGEVIYFKGRNLNGFSTSEETYTSFSIGGAVSLTGNVMTLIDDGKGEEGLPIPCDYCFYRLFENCSGIVSISSNFLPSEKLKRYSYAYMFENCHSLTDFPSTLLPDKHLDDGDEQYDGWMCYCGMFMNCRGLKAIPQGLLQAETLSTYCYYGMFQGCTNITKIESGVLPAEKMEYGCYFSMFADCTSLTNISPQLLQSQQLAENCYGEMFAECTSLVSIDESTYTFLPATTLAPRCYQQMFYGCSMLTTSPKLQSTILAKQCYSGMFYNCTGLTNAGLPSLPANNLVERCYECMFYNCNTLSVIPTLSAQNLADYCYFEMFKGCEKLGDLSSQSLPATTLKPYCYKSMFSNSSVTLPPTIAATTLTDATGCCSSMFSDCSKLTASPALPAQTPCVSCYSSMFINCKALTSAGTIGLNTFVIDATKKIYAYSCCSMMFGNCNNFMVYDESGSRRTSFFVCPSCPEGTTEDTFANNMLQGTTKKPQNPWTPTSGETYYYYL